MIMIGLKILRAASDRGASLRLLLAWTLICAPILHVVVADSCSGVYNILFDVSDPFTSKPNHLEGNPKS